MVGLCVIGLPSSVDLKVNSESCHLENYDVSIDLWHVQTSWSEALYL